jgi:hypothetical protein
MAELKTQPTDHSVRDFIAAIENEDRRRDCQAVLEIMQEATGERPRIWGSGMVGFGSYHYKYASGREGDWFLTGFAPRKNDLTLYIMPGFDRFEALMKRLGKHKTGKSCLYIKRLSDIDPAVLKELVADSVAHMRQQYG